MERQQGWYNHAAVKRMRIGITVMIVIVLFNYNT